MLHGNFRSSMRHNRHKDVTGLFAGISGASAIWNGNVFVIATQSVGTGSSLDGARLWRWWGLGLT